MKPPLTKPEQAALADLAPIRPTPLPIELLVAGGPRALAKYLRTLGTTPKRRLVKA